ncbi:LLM class oxidoreductase [Corynebacterium sp. H78]|uniref:LLM class oxidoreductase n=1 Tax=Corynebacterium sp. H78 TaxID=3133417 RepID=UPI0030AD592C
MSELFALSDVPHWELPGFRRTYAPGSLTIGLSLPIEEDSEESPDDHLDNQVRLVKKAESGGFSAVWVRDIPLRVETFGDVGQVYDPWMYLSYLAAHTKSIALGTGAIVVPFQHPLVMAKRAATIDRLSGGRFLFGVATGDRPEEFPAFGQDKGKRDDVFREHIAVYRKAMTTSYRPIKWSGGKMGGSDVVPKPIAREVPLIATGSCQQSMEWKAEHMHGWFTYHRSLPEQKVNIARWREATADYEDFKPFSESLWLDLVEDPDAPAAGADFGYRPGRNALLELLDSQRALGINHVSVNFRRSRRPAEDQMDEFIEYVMPEIGCAISE